jgi:DNA-binding CsgD family transcriptional regulator
MNKKLRRGREYYGKNYEEALRLHQQGLSVSEIAKKLNISYSAVYHWVKGIRKPEAGNVNMFISYLEKNGPAPVVDVKNKFPKHNELFLIAVRRGLPVKRLMLQKKLSDYSVWYYLAGQESELEKRTDLLMEKIKEVKERLGSAFK